MSPRDALWRMAAPFSVTSLRSVTRANKGGSMSVAAPDLLPKSDGKTEGKAEAKMGAQARLSAILAEVEAVQAEGGLPEFRLQPRRNVSQPLRVFLILDVLAMIGGYVIAWGLAAVANSLFFDRSLQDVFGLDDGTRFGEVFLVAACVIAWFAHTGHYRTRMPFWAETQKIIMTMGFALLMDGFFQFAAKQSMSRLWLMSSWGFAAFGMIFARGIARHVMRRLGIWQVRTLLIGSGSVAEDARAGLATEPGLGYRIVMQIENLPATLEKNSHAWRKLCDRFSADYVLIALDGHELAESEDAMAMLVREGIPFSVSPPMRNLPVLGMVPQYFFKGLD